MIRDGLAGVNEAVAADLDSDEDVDMVVAVYGQDGQVVWFENSDEPKDRWQMHRLKSPWPRAAQVIVADLDGNGWPDLAAVNELGRELWWWQSHGREVKPDE